MAESARILAVESMAEARGALAQFAEEVGRVLAGVDADIMRTTQWLQHDRPAHWKREIRAREDDVLKARNAISRKQIVAAPEPAAIVEERRTLERAQRRLADAQARQAATHRWALTFERQAMAYKSAAHELRAMVSGHIPESLGRIGRLMESVEEYLSIAPPVSNTEAPPPDAGDESPGPEGVP